MSPPAHEGPSTALGARLEPTTRVLSLTVVEGPDLGRTLLLDRAATAPLLVGQGPACDLRLTDPLVSRRHASFEHLGGRARLIDLGSTNGTFVDGVGVTDAFVRGGELVRVGSTALRVDERGEAPTPPPPSTADHFGRVLGASLEMRRIYPLCQRLAASDVPLLIEGETGTGKEALAEAIHEQGPRAAKPFVVFDCTAVPANLLESELFGHERGAFTGAVGARPGVFEQADGGTLFIDEIGDLDLALQPKLLRALDRAQVRRLGGNRTLAVDVRVLAATRRNLDNEVQLGRFRDDLFHRLVVTRVELPPLRRRQGDVRFLVSAFCAALGGDARLFDDELLARWGDAPWPGNVRELRNAVARRVALSDAVPPAGDAPMSDDADDLAAIVRELLARDWPLARARQAMTEAFERRYLARVLTQHGGNVRRAAEAAGIARRYFQLLRARHRDEETGDGEP